MIKRILLILITCVILCLALVVSVWVNISEEKIGRWTEYQINQRLDSNLVCEIKAFQTKLWGARIDQIAITDRSSSLELVRLENILFHVNRLSTILNQTIPFSAELYGSDLTGEFKFFRNISVSLDIDGFRPNFNPYIRKTNLIRSNPSLDFQGKLSSTDPLTLEVSTRLSNTIVSGKPEHTKLPLEIPETSLDSLVVKASLKDSLGEIELASRGDISGNINGTVNLKRDNPRQSQFSLRVKAEFADTYKAKLGLLQNILKAYMDKNENISIRVTGTIHSVKIDRI